MPRASTWVIKLGGAMMAAPELRHWLRACAEPGMGARCVIVPGGGAFADGVRALQAAWAFDDQLAHELALDAMRMNARILRALSPDLLPLTTLEPAALADTTAGAWVWSPPRPFAPASLPPSWTATADSIALWLSQCLGADALFLVKSVAAATLAPASAESFAREQLLDLYFPQLLRRHPLPVRIVVKSQYAEFAQARARLERYGVAVT